MFNVWDKYETFRDGVKFHDVACHHRKPVICEEL